MGGTGHNAQVEDVVDRRFAAYEQLRTRHLQMVLEARLYTGAHVHPSLSFVFRIGIRHTNENGEA
jgi:hypothetical protein